MLGGFPFLKLDPSSQEEGSLTPCLDFPPAIPVSGPFISALIQLAAGGLGLRANRKRTPPRKLNPARIRKAVS